MDALDVFKLAKQVNEESLSGSISEELLLKQNVLYGASETIGRFTRLKSNGEFAEGCFQDGKFIVEKTLSSPSTQ
ncbi:hypothetical protein [Alteromonas abrolhosensis]|uniref:hypothetical protein n=1 Tax=Alteromonas abrolhosensis TaxID=1892904 RepID=UPI003515244B